MEEDFEWVVKVQWTPLHNLDPQEATYTGERLLDRKDQAELLQIVVEAIRVALRTCLSDVGS